MSTPDALSYTTAERQTDGGDRAADEPIYTAAPPRMARFVRRVARLRPGKYVLTLTVTEERAFWTIQEMGRVEG